MAAKIYGVATFADTTLTGLATPILNDFTYAASIGTQKELMGNPASGVAADTYQTEATGETYTIHCAFGTKITTPKNLLNVSVILTPTADDTTTTAAYTGIVDSIELTGRVDDWWVYAVTLKDV
jgi:hypothetical protein